MAADAAIDRSPLGILAGGGSLPRDLIQAASSKGRAVFVVAFPGQTDPLTVENVPHAWIALGAAATLLERLRAEGVREVVMAGRIKRPTFAELQPDWRAAKFFTRVGLRALGDDGLLRGVAAELEAEGFVLLAAQAVLERLLVSEGVLGSHRPDAQAEADIARGLTAANLLGRVDVGQAVIVQQGIVLAVEAAEGTDAMIARAGTLAHAGPGGVLVKIAKTGQDERLDMPAIGRQTVEAARQAGLRGIAVEAARTLILDQAATVAAADAAGLFLVAVKPQ